MPNERNALAELAHTLCGVFIDNRCHTTVGECVGAMNAIKKAMRTIAELAKVEFYWDGVEMWPMHDYEAVQALVNGRAIAAE